MTTLGLTILLGAVATSFALALVIGFVPMNPFVRASLMSLGITGWFVLPFVAPGHEIDIGGAYWFGVALSAVGAWLLGLAVGAIGRYALRWRRDRAQHSPS